MPQGSPVTPGSGSPQGRSRRALTVSAASLLAAIVMTWPLVTGLGHLGRTQNSGDAKFSVWNIAWVAHALVTDPTTVFDANIFYPHRRTLAYSELNLAAGALAIPAWVATGNPFAAHNTVLLFAFAATAAATWLLARRLTGDGAAAATSAVLFAFCPYLFGHTAHIQLLMVGVIPLSLLAFHHLLDQPSPRAGLLLGLSLALAGLSCAYYGVFSGLTVGYLVLFYAWSRRLWKSAEFWLAVMMAAALSIILILPFFLPYVEIQQETGFSRSLDDARQWSAYWRSYLASGAHAHVWLLPIIKDWNHALLFPGYLSIGLGVYGLAAMLRHGAAASSMRTDRETAIAYGSLAVLAFWASLGPRAGLYSVFYALIPIFSLLRAPERMGILVMLSLALFAGFAVTELRRRFPAHARTIAIAACGLAMLELNAIPFDWRPDSIPPIYRVLAPFPRGPLAEFPFYDRRIDFHIHTRYLLNSTVHWQPLVNGYSDHIPADYRTLASTLATFPSRESFEALKDRRVRYISVNRGRQGYGRDVSPEIMRRLEPYLQHLRPIADDGDIVLYEVVSWPK
jgi:hypothetical protein